MSDELRRPRVRNFMNFGKRLNMWQNTETTGGKIYIGVRVRDCEVIRYMNLNDEKGTDPTVEAIVEMFPEDFLRNTDFLQRCVLHAIEFQA